jgi:hypothetical protein
MCLPPEDRPSALQPIPAQSLPAGLQLEVDRAGSALGDLQMQWHRTLASDDDALIASLESAFATAISVFAHGLTTTKAVRAHKRQSSQKE